MPSVALGFRVHSGWAAVIASSETLDVIHRGIIRIIDPSMPGAAQPYHFVEHWALPEAEHHLRVCTQRTAELTRAVLEPVLADLKTAGHEVHTCGLLTASGRALGSLRAILASHPMIHTAEGEFFREAVRAAAQHLGLTVHPIREKELLESARIHLDDVQERLAQIGSNSARLGVKTRSSRHWRPGSRSAYHKPLWL